MTQEAYFKYALQQGYLLKLNWYTSMFSIPLEPTEYIYPHAKGYDVITDDPTYLEGSIKDITPLQTTTTITLTPDDMTCIKAPITTTIGKAIANYLTLEHALRGNAPFINDTFSISDIENKYIIPSLKDNPSHPIEIDDTNIYVKDYINLGNSVMFLQSLAPILVVSATPKSTVKPPNIEKTKKEYIEILKKKYGPNAFEDPAVTAELESMLMKFDLEHLKDEGSLNIVLNKKLLGARKKMHLVHGVETPFNNTDKTVFIENSLEEGWVTDPDKLTTMINSSRLASYGRSAEVRDAGTVAKKLLRVSNAISITEDDCKVKYGLSVVITKDNIKYLNNCHAFIMGKEIKMDSLFLQGNIGNIVEVRNPMFCKTKDGNFCKKCIGDFGSGHVRGVSVMSSNLGGKLLNYSMKKIHQTTTSLVTIEFEDLFR